MPHFRYRAVTPAGDLVVGEVEAPSREEVIRRIEYLGHLTIEVAATGMLSRSRAPSGKTPRPREVTIFLRQLALLVGAGLTLEVALQTLGEDAGKALAWFAGAIRSSIAAGDSFADALERHPTIIEPTHIAMSAPARHRESLMWCYARSSRIARGGSCLPNGSVQQSAIRCFSSDRRSPF